MNIRAAQPYNKDLLSLRHRASELSKGIENIMSSRDGNWTSLLNQCSIISQQLLLIQNDFEKGISEMTNKFMVQPLHEHFQCEILGVKKIPQVENEMMTYTKPLNLDKNSLYKKYQKQNSPSNVSMSPIIDDDINNNENKIDEWSETTESQLIRRLQEYNEMIADLFEYNKDKSSQIRQQSELQEIINQKQNKIKFEKKENKENKNDIDIDMDEEIKNKERLDAAKEEEQLEYAKQVVSYMFSGDMPRHRIIR